MKRRAAPFVLAALGLVVGGCAGPRANVKQHPSATASAAGDDGRLIAGLMLVTPPLPPPVAPPASPDVSHEVMGWVVLRQAGPLVDAIGRVAGIETGAGASDGWKLLFVEGLHVDGSVVDAIDVSRPAAVALLNPSLLKGAGTPVLALVPVRGAAVLEAALARAGMHPRRTPWGLACASPGGTMYIAVHGGWAEVAFRKDLVGAARATLEPALAEKDAQGALSVHVALDNVYSGYGAQLDAMLKSIGLGGDERGDPQLAFALRGMRVLAGLTSSLASVDVDLGVDAGALSVTVRADGKPEGAWAHYVASQQPGAVWGARLLPRDSVLVYSTRRSDDTVQSESHAELDYVAAAAPLSARAHKAAWTAALDAAAADLGSEVIYGIWPGKDGGVGLGGAFRIKRQDAARTGVMALYRRLGNDLAGVVARALELDPRRYHVTVAVKSTVARVAGTPVDAVEVTVAWPRTAGVERHRFEELFGDKLVMGVAFVGEAGVFALGRDWRARIGTMVAAAHGAPGLTLADEPSFVQALDYRPQGRVTLTWLPTQPMARFMKQLLRTARALGPDKIAGLDPVLDAIGDGVIVAATNTSGARYEVATRLPASAVPALLTVGGSFWRIALAPIVNPPTIPPLPLPPAHVTPKLPDEGTAPLRSLAPRDHQTL